MNEKHLGKEDNGGSAFARYRRAFFRGLGALLPTVLTIYIIFICIQFVHLYVAMPINGFICNNYLMKSGWGESLLIDFSDLTAGKKREVFEKKPEIEGNKQRYVFKDPKLAETELRRAMPWFPGWFIAFVGIFAVGFLLSSFVGKRLFSMGENAIIKIPLIKTLYPYAKQISDFLFKEKKVEYSQVVLVEYPRKGIFSIGFLTGQGLKSLNATAGRELFNVFIPTSPTPMTGFMIFVSPGEIVPLDIGVEDAFKVIISCGVYIPEHEVTNLGHEPAERQGSEGVLGLGGRLKGSG